ncbi:MAG: hypothetical protein NTY04_02305 [Candidatus Staskawiczbacteria bacterium]|nr:hypothetical protein [Candidatus Staskawiczbacteria bacterium]
MADNIQDEIEDKIIDCINSGVKGRLVIFKPEKNSFGEDLIVKKRGDYKEKEIHLQINSLVGPGEDVNFVKDFPKDNFKTDKNFYLIFVYFNEALQKINDYIWLVPSLKFKETAETINDQKILRFESSLDVKQNNKYSEFLVDTKDLGKLMLNIFVKNVKPK